MGVLGEEMGGWRERERERGMERIRHQGPLGIVWKSGDKEGRGRWSERRGREVCFWGQTCIH